MEMRTLKYFVEIARQKNMTKASAALHVSQPNLSVQMKSLEEELGCKLFTRSNYSIRLTEDGSFLFKRAMRILNLADDTAQTIADNNGKAQFKGDIHLGCAQSFNVCYLARAAESLKASYPKIRYFLESGDAYNIEARLDDGVLDFAAVTYQFDFKKYNHLDIPGEDVWGLLVRNDSALARQGHISVQELKDIPLFVPRQGAELELPKWLGETMEDLNIVGYFDLIYNASIFVEEGYGCALSYDKLINTSAGSRLRFLPIKPAIYSKMCIIWKKHQTFTPVVRLFLDELIRQVEMQENNQA
ncbi:MAG: LysR family transcriptional regulator [Fibrobacter sp.]|nr:LysR family transcriptional regulator [Fibrobacter sp.]